jgi:hypothetical protein
MDLKETVCYNVDWIHLALGTDQALVSVAMNHRISKSVGEFLE